MWHSEIRLSPSFDAHGFFAGEQAVTKGLRESGFRVSAQDIKLHRAMDMMTPAGFAFETFFNQNVI
jgi:hypothetical protein